MTQKREPGEPVYATTEDTVNKKGYVMTLEDAAVAGNVKLADAALETPYGIAVKTTKNVITEAYEKTVPLAMHIDGIADVQADPTNAAIAKGDPLAVTANATVDKVTWNSTTLAVFLSQLKGYVGQAEEALALTTGGLIKVRLALKNLGP